MSQIKIQLKRFFIAGLSAVSTDLIAYYILLLFVQHDIAKGISFVLGTVVAYIINKYWTFEKHEKSYKEMLKFAILYTITLGANVFTNKLILDLTNNFVFLSFVFATGISTILNFSGQKWWVFK